MVMYVAHVCTFVHSDATLSCGWSVAGPAEAMQHGLSCTAFLEKICIFQGHFDVLAACLILTVTSSLNFQVGLSCTNRCDKKHEHYTECDLIQLLVLSKDFVDGWIYHPKITHSPSWKGHTDKVCNTDPSASVAS